MKITSIVGARPQFVKAAAVSRAVRKHRGARDERLDEVIVHTGQHFDDNMSAVFFDELGIPKPEYHLGIAGGPHGQMTGRQLEALEQVMLAERPDVVLVYGDTNSTLAGALAAAKLHVPVAHVEAGLRSFNRAMPEEVNRVLTDHVSELLFAPSEVAVANLHDEGITDGVHLVGDVMYDLALYYRDRARVPAEALRLGLDVSDFVLCTVHRPHNVDAPDRLASIVAGLGTAGRPVVWPVHPRTRAQLGTVPSNVQLWEPVGYLEMVWLLAHCGMVATDSGGLQKEAFFHQKPCLTLREETEWVELVEGGHQLLVGADRDRIAAGLSGFRRPGGDSQPYGVGDSAVRIAGLLAG